MIFFYKLFVFFFFGLGVNRGYKDVVWVIYYDFVNEVFYIGLEDGVFVGFLLVFLLERLIVGDFEVDDDGGDGREEDEYMDEESEIEIESSEESDDDEDEDMEEEGFRYGFIIGVGFIGWFGVDKKEERCKKRYGFY